MLHKAIRDQAVDMLTNKKDVSLALKILFYVETKTNDTTRENLSVILDAAKLDDMGLPSASASFTK